MVTRFRRDEQPLLSRGGIFKQFVKERFDLLIATRQWHDLIAAVWEEVNA